MRVDDREEQERNKRSAGRLLIELKQLLSSWRFSGGAIEAAQRAFLTFIRDSGATSDQQNRVLGDLQVTSVRSLSTEEDVGA